MKLWQMFGAVVGLLMAGYGFWGVLEGDVSAWRWILVVAGLILLVASLVAAGRTNTAKDERQER